MVKTNYGFRKQGSSNFVIVAPHAAGDDLKTKEIAVEISKYLDSYLVVNDKFMKPSNSRAGSYPNLIEDFNRLSWSGTAYLWKQKHPQMKEFYDHINEYAREARKYRDGRSIIVYIHGMKDNQEQIGIDIGFGARYDKGKLKGTQGKVDKHPNAGKNTGEFRAEIVDILKLKEILQDKFLDDCNLKVGIGKYYAAWSRQDGVQYHTGTSDYSFQLEISSLLRKPEHIKFTSKLIADALSQVYSKN